MAIFNKVKADNSEVTETVNEEVNSVEEEQNPHLNIHSTNDSENVENSENSENEPPTTFNTTSNDRQLDLPESVFGDLIKYIKQKDITDIDFNGTDLWLTTVHNQRIKVKPEDCDIDNNWALQFAKNISNYVGEEFNQLHPVLEGETRELRLSIVHPIVSQTGVSICIRKTPPSRQISEKSAIENNYTDKDVLSLLANCVKAHMNFVICGMPKAGKTELGKLISTYIPIEERVITIEDVLEWRYREIHPEADSLEWQTFYDLTFSDLIVASLKQNPIWVMIAETRGEEVRELINGFSTGVHGMTTLHTDDIQKIPMRMINMVNDTQAEERFLNNIYEFIDVGILVAIHKDKDGNSFRQIEQVGFFSAENGTNVCQPIVLNGKILDAALPPRFIMNKFQKDKVDNIFENAEVDNRLREQGMTEIEEPLHEIFAGQRVNQSAKPKIKLNSGDNNIEEQIKQAMMGGN